MTVATGAAARVRELLDADDATEASTRESRTPRNFALNAANGACTKTAEQLASPGVVLPLLLAAVGAPVVLAGALEPVRRGASLLPGLIVSGRMRAFERRKGFWVAAGLAQAVALVAGAAAPGLALGSDCRRSGGRDAPGVQPGQRRWIGGVRRRDGQDDRQAAPRPAAGPAGRSRRGGDHHGGWLAATLGPQAARGTFVGLLLASAALWVLAAWLFARIREPAGAVAGGRTPLAEAGAGARCCVGSPGSGGSCSLAGCWR